MNGNITAKEILSIVISRKDADNVITFDNKIIHRIRFDLEKNMFVLFKLNTETVDEKIERYTLDKFDEIVEPMIHNTDLELELMWIYMCYFYRHKEDKKTALNQVYPIYLQRMGPYLGAEIWDKKKITEHILNYVDITLDPHSVKNNDDFFAILQLHYDAKRELERIFELDILNPTETKEKVLQFIKRYAP